MCTTHRRAHECGLDRKNHHTGRPDRAAAGNGHPAHAARDSGAEMKSGGQHHGKEKENWAMKIKDMEPRPESCGSRPRKTYTNDSSRREKGNLPEQGHKPLDPALRWATNKNERHCCYQKIDSHTNKRRLNLISTWQTAEPSTHRQERVVQKHTRIKITILFS
jgi:hypothetical protein